MDTQKESSWRGSGKIVLVRMAIVLGLAAGTGAEAQALKELPLPQGGQIVPNAPLNLEAFGGPPLAPVEPANIVVPLDVSSSTINSTTWTPIGPFPIPNGQTQGRVDPVSGRVTAIVVHPSNPNIVYVGTAQGGVYRTLDGGATWTPLMDAAQSLAIGALAIDPATPSTLFVGTGEGNRSGDSFFGVGMYRIVNADTAPTLQGPFEARNNGGNGHAFLGTCATRIIIDPNNNNNMFVAVTFGVGGMSGTLTCCGGSNPISGYIGLFFCANAQASTPTFALVNPASLPGGGFAAVTDIAIEPGNANTLLLAQQDFNSGSPGSGIYRSVNALSGASATYTRTLSYAGSLFNVKFAINKIGPVVTVLAATEESSGTLRKSVDGGATWPTILGGSPGFCDGQCWYDLVIAMHPNDANIVYMGGSAHSGSAHTLIKSINGGVSFSDIDTGLHADSHAFAFDPSNLSTIYFGNDGGIWKSVNAGSSWTSLNNSTFSATQFESLALHPKDRNFMIGGTQDNGTPMMKPDGTWTRADFGDGGFALIDQSSPNTTSITMYHTYFNQTGSLIGFGRVTDITAAHDGGWSGLGAGLVADPAEPDGGEPTTPNGIGISDSVLFYAPMALGPGTPNTVYFGSDRLYRSTDRGTSMTVVSQAPFVSGVPVSAIGISSQNDNVRIVGLTSGKVFATTTGSSTLTDVTGSIPAKYIARAVIDPNNANTAYVTISGFGLSAGQHIWKTTNLSGGGATWGASGTGIPDIPVNALVIDPRNSSHLYAGTDAGVYVSINGGGTWTIYGSGLPHVAVFGIAIQDSFRVLRAATHGRGIWEILPTLVPDLSLSKTGSPNPVLVGSNLTYTLTITNRTSAPASSVTVTDTLPANVTFVSASPGCINIGGTVVCSLGTVSNAAVTLAIIVTPTAGGFVTNIATVATTTLESNLANNSATEITAVNRPPNASDIVAATKQDLAIGIPKEKLLLLASDPDGDPLLVSSVSPNSTNGGTVVLEAEVVTYTPASSYIGADSFTYTVSDGRGGTASATVLVQVRSADQVSGNMFPPAAIAGGFRVSFAGIPGRTYTLQRAPSVTGPWSTLATVAVGTSGIGSYDDTNAPPGSAFYRTVYP